MDMSPDMMEKHENVTFEDMHLGHSDTRGAIHDPLRDHAMATDAELSDFFSRPIKVGAFQWTPGNDLFAQLNPWEEFWENPRVINRIANFKLLRCTMKVKFVINGNPFYYGRAIASYLPLASTDDFTTVRQGTEADLVGATQRPHVYLDPTACQGGELELPFFTQYNVLDIPRADWRNMGTLSLISLNNLKHANGATDPITISVFAWAEKVSYSIPTQSAPAALVPQAGWKKFRDETKGIVSKPASVVAKAAGALSEIPVIGPYARSTEIGASNIAHLAALFGFSKPASDERSSVVPASRTSLAATDGVEHLSKFTVDSKQELSIDPRIGGLDVNDEMPISSIACRETFLTKFPWPLPDVGIGPETLLWNSIVDPGLHRINATAGNFDEIHLTAPAFAVMPFQYWKGSMRFRFQVVASNYHKGRIKVVYDPTGTPTGDAEYNTAYTTIVDISDTRDFTVDCGWGQATPFRHHISAGSPESEQFSVAPLPILNTFHNSHGNGTIAVYIVNDLTSPDSVIDNDIEVNVFVSMLDDFEVAGPSDTDIRYLRTYDPDGELAPNYGSGSLVKQSAFESAPYGAESKGQHAEYTPVDGTLNKVHFGEVVPSFRSLIKRFNLHEIILMEQDLDFGNRAAHFFFRRDILPYQTGYASRGVQTGFAELDSLGYWCHGYTPLISYLTWAHAAWRGGVRYHMDASNNFESEGNALSGNSANVSVQSWAVGRTAADVPVGITNDYIESESGGFTLIKDLLDVNELLSGNAGMTRWNTRVNPQHTFEVPYYSHKRFEPSRRHTNFSPTTDTPHYQLQTSMPVDSAINPSFVFHMVAAAEDFMPMFYLGPPRLYRITGPTPAPEEEAEPKGRRSVV